MVGPLAVLTVSLALCAAVTAQQTSFTTDSACRDACIQGSCSAFIAGAYVCLCKPGYTGTTCDHLQGSDSASAPVEAPAGEAPLLAPTPAPAALLDCGLGAHALFNNGTAYCNCDGTGHTGTNCQISVGTPAPSPGSAAAVPTSGRGPSLTPASGPSLAAAGVPPVSSPLKGSCPQGSLGCTLCSDGSYCLNGGRCNTFGGCECVSSGSQLYGGPNCQTLAGSTTANNTANSGQTTTSSKNPMQTSDHHISGVGVAIIVIVVLGVVAGIVAGIAFWKARGRTSKFDRFADQPEIFRGAVTNL